VRVRVIDARITVTVAGGTTVTGTYRLLTTPADARRHPGRLLPPAWEHESAYYAPRHTITDGRVLVSDDTGRTGVITRRVLAALLPPRVGLSWLKGVVRPERNNNPPERADRRDRASDRQRRQACIDVEGCRGRRVT